MAEQNSNPKRRGRKPRGGIASLSEILAFQQQPIAPPTNILQTYQTYQQQPQVQMTDFGGGGEGGQQQQVHHHTLDFDLAHWNQHSTTPQAMQIHNFTAKSTTSTTTTTAASIKIDPDQIADEDLDELDLFPSDDPVDFEVIFKTQTAASANRGLHMSQRDRDNLEVYRPQNASSTMNPSDGGGCGGGCGGGGGGNGGSMEASPSFVQIPEHMRIVSLRMDATNEAQTSPREQQQVPEETTRDVFPDFFHPFRIHTYSPAVHAHQPSHALEDGISWPSRSPFACWWCRHTFETYPKVAPVWIRGDEVEVIGNFCTWNCAKAYCMKEFRRLDLFNTFYYKLFQAHANEVVPSPSFLTIDTFGGPLTIQNFRKTLNNPERQLQFDMFAHTHIRVSKMFITK